MALGLVQHIKWRIGKQRMRTYKRVELKDVSHKKFNEES